MNYTVYADNELCDIHTAKIAPRPYNEIAVQEFCSVNLKGETTLRIKSKKKIESMAIRPLSSNIEFSFNEEEIKIVLKKNMNFSVEINGSISDNLLIFASGKEDYSALMKEKNLYFFKKGVHEVNRLLIDKDNSVVYFEDGAIIKGKIEINSCKNIVVCGNGIIDDGDYNDLNHRIALDVLACENVRIYDVTVIQSLFWCCRIFSCKNIDVKNVKVIGYRGNNDGFDVCSSENVHIHECFTRTTDDSLVVKAFDERDKKSVHVVFEGSETNMENTFNSLKNTSHVLFENCVLWNDFARPIEVGVSLRCDDVYDIVFRNIDVIHSTTGYPILGIHHGDRADVHNILFEDIRVEDAPGAQMFDFRITDSAWNTDDKKGKISDITIKNLKLIGNPEIEFLPEKSRIEGFSNACDISNVVLHNIVYNNKAASTFDDCNIELKNFAQMPEIICDENLQKMTSVKSKISIEKQFIIDEKGVYHGKIKTELTNISDSFLSGDFCLKTSPKNFYKDIHYNYSLKKDEKCIYITNFSLPAGKYVIEIQSENTDMLSDWILIELPFLIFKDKAYDYNIINYYGVTYDAPKITYTNDGLLFDAKSVDDIKIYTALPVEKQDGEIVFSVEETDFGEAKAIVFANNKYVSAPQIRCPEEITYVFHNEPKVKEITVNVLKKSDNQTAFISFEKLNIPKQTKEFLIEVEVSDEKLSKYRRPFTMFHSVIPKYSCHMFARVIKEDF